MGRFYPAGSNGGKRMGEAGARMRIRSGRVRMGAGEPPSRFEAHDARRFAAAVWRFGDSCSHRDPGSRARLVRVARDAASEMLRYAAQVGLTPPARSRLAAGIGVQADPPSGKIRWTAGRFLKGLHNTDTPFSVLERARREVDRKRWGWCRHYRNHPFRFKSG